MKRTERGSGLIVIIVVIAFLLTVGVLVVTVTSTGPKVSGNVRNQEEAFNAAEAGFDASRKQVESNLSDGTWESFDGHYLEEPAGIDLPTIGNAMNPLYFRSLSDEVLLGLIDTNGDGVADVSNVIFCRQPFTTTQLGAD
ncbi:MAG TPA: PilX N-terminal domain-containing pilus assembly protein, partial [Acidobacteriota bacterium]|nr:PilX N-terminal domain-containing pilus assembly protein [Acidobacteriota bacterium]